MKTPREILVVEDNQADAMLIRKTFHCQPPDCVLTFVRDGEEALERLFPKTPPKQFTLPDMILLDLNIPKVNGLQVLEKVRSEKTTRTIPVVVFTSSNSERDIEGAYEAGACSYICKPIDFDVFSTLMAATAKYWLETNTFKGRRIQTS